MKPFNTRTLVTTAVMSVIAFVLFSFEFIIYQSLKIDFSDLPVIITGSLFGFGPGFMVAVIKNILHILFISKDAAVIGEVANLAYATFILIPFVFYKKKSLPKDVVFFAIATLFSTILMFGFNLFVVMPWYGIPAASRVTLLMTVYTPFNIVKGALLCALFYVIRPQLDRIKL